MIREMDDIIARLRELGGASDRAREQVRAGGLPVPQRRWQDELIESHIPDGASVLDLGCGRGQLLERLIRSKNVRSQGVEQDPAAVFDCVARGVPVLQTDLDEGLRGFADQSFDYVVLEETLQTLHRPAEMLRDMLRVGRRGILSFPNFAHWRVRLDLLVRGRMPTTPQLPYGWHDTPNIHLLSLQDFLDWAGQNGVRIVAGHALADGAVRPLHADDNLLAEEVLLVVDRDGGQGGQQWR
jgi:methionine biosynthesis protein MetW